MQGEFLIISLAIVVACVGSFIAARATIGSGGLWPAAWAVVLIGLFVDRIYPSPLSVSIGNLFGTLFAGLILAGAIRFTGRPLPVWLLPAAALLGIARAGTALMGNSQLAGVIAVFPEPAAELAAAFLVYRYTAKRTARLQQRLLAPALVVLAAVDLWTGLVMLQGGDRTPLAFAWLLCAAFLSALQLLTFLDQLQTRIRDRTQELAKRNAELNAEVDERVRVEELLRLSRERYRKLSRLNSDFSFVARLHPDGASKLEWITGAFERITGYTIEEAETRDWDSHVYPEDLAKTRERFVASEPGKPVSLEFRIVCKDGSIRWVEQFALVEQDEASGTRVMYGATHDVTWRKLAEEEKQRLEARMAEAKRLESLGLLAGGVAHDFNNLLTVILGNTAMVIGDLPDDSPHRERLERVRKTADYAADLTGQMLAYAGSAVMTPKPLDLSRLAEDMIELLRAELPKKVELRTDFASNLPQVEGDETRMRQVVLNLVTNAAEALEKDGGTLLVRTGELRVDAEELAKADAGSDAEPGRYILLEVRDDGPGMDEATKARIFEPFYTTKSFAPGKKASGRGLGLAAVLGIVRGHRGAIEIETAPGKGTRFRVLLPANDGVRVEKAQAKLPAPALSPSTTLLVIDDDELVREVAFEFLKRAGFRVLLAASGSEALELMRDRGDEIRLVLLDFVMPDMDGESVLEGIRELRPQMPVIAVTGYSQAEGSRARLGLNGYLEKPYDPDVLIGLVREALSD